VHAVLLHCISPLTCTLHSVLLFTDCKFNEGNSGTRSKLLHSEAILAAPIVAVPACSFASAICCTRFRECLGGLFVPADSVQPAVKALPNLAGQDASCVVPFSQQ
jgi:hypothetical protein